MGTIDSSEPRRLNLKDKVAKSVEGKEPSWRNAFSRWFVGNRNAADNSNLGVASHQESSFINENTPKMVEEELAAGVEFFQKLNGNPLVTLETLTGVAEKGWEMGNVIANLIANNGFDATTEQEFIGLKLDGHLIGVGAASLFSMIEGFDNCQSVTGIDVHPSPVAIGRVITDLFKEQVTFDNFVRNLEDESQLKERLIAKGLPPKYLEATSASVKDALAQYKKVKTRYPGVRVQGIQVAEMGLKNVFPLGSIERHYEQYVSLAKQNKINFVQADFFDPELWKGLDAADPSIKSEKNLVFGSNAIDHVFRASLEDWDQWIRGGQESLALQDQDRKENAMANNFAAWKATEFAFTLNSLGYKLHLQDKPPTFGYDEERGRPTLVNETS